MCIHRKWKTLESNHSNKTKIKEYLYLIYFVAYLYYLLLLRVPKCISKHKICLDQPIPSRNHVLTHFYCKKLQSVRSKTLESGKRGKVTDVRGIKFKLSVIKSHYLGENINSEPPLMSVKAAFAVKHIAIHFTSITWK